MRNIFIFAIIIILTACSSGPADGDYSFELYAHGDIHGRFFSNTYVDGGVNEGSLSGIYSFISQRREAAGADKVILLGKINTSAAYSEEMISVYAMTGLTPGEQDLDEDEALNVIEMPFAKAYDMAASGKLIDAKTRAALLMAKEQLGL